MTQRKTIRRSAAVLLVAAAAVACSSTPEPKKPEPPGPRSAAAAPAEQPTAAAPAQAPAAADSNAPVSGMIDKTVTTTATVTAIDMTTRHVTLKREDGKEFTIVCGPEVRNLPQVKIGDVVTCEYRESIAYEVKKPGEAKPGATLTGAAGRAKEGEMPAAAAGQALTLTATIVAIDRENKRVSLQGPSGDVVVVQVRDADKLARVNVGELVEITYTEAMAVSVSTPMAK
jgi:Cu/Ag efflux protein CusF